MTATSALDSRLSAIEQQLSGMAGEAVGQRIAAAEWRSAQVHTPC